MAAILRPHNYNCSTKLRNSLDHSIHAHEQAYITVNILSLWFIKIVHYSNGLWWVSMGKPKAYTQAM